MATKEALAFAVDRFDAYDTGHGAVLLLLDGSFTGAAPRLTRPLLRARPDDGPACEARALAHEAPDPTHWSLTFALPAEAIADGTRYTLDIGRVAVTLPAPSEMAATNGHNPDRLRLLQLECDALRQQLARGNAERQDLRTALERERAEASAAAEREQHEHDATAEHERDAHAAALDDERKQHAEALAIERKQHAEALEQARRELQAATKRLAAAEREHDAQQRSSGKELGRLRSALAAARHDLEEARTRADSATSEVKVLRSQVASAPAYRSEGDQHTPRRSAHALELARRHRGATDELTQASSPAPPFLAGAVAGAIVAVLVLALLAAGVGLL